MPKVIQLAIGAALLSHLLLALLWLGWAIPGLVATLFLLGFCGWAWRLRPALRPADLVFLPLTVLYLIYALAPPTAADAIGYHLGLATEWLRAGSLARRTVGFYDSLPHGIETLFMAAAGLGGMTAATLVHFSFLLGTIPLMIRVAARLGFEGRPAALLYFAAPVVGMAGTSAYVDAALAFYALSTFWLLLDDQLEWAGLTAGFCYAIKMSGGLVTVAAGLYLLKRRSWRGLALAAAMVLPWLAYAWWLTGNPVAPMFPRVFQSPDFYPAVVEGWIEYVRTYGGPWRERWWEATLGGARAAGLLGPGFLLAPVALLALRTRRHAVLVLAAAICGGAWALNSGARFLIPSAVFLALAITAVLPPRAAWALALTQAVLCWPTVLDRYVPAYAWRLAPAWPWRAALRLDPEDDYLRRAAPEALVSKMVNRHAKPHDRVLDFGEIPRAYVHGAEVLAGWQYAPAHRAIEALETARVNDIIAPRQLRASWTRRRLRSIRFELLSTGADPWSIQELRLLRGGEAVFPSRAWELDARPNPWEAPLAFDRNPTSSWQTWEPRRAGMYLEIAGTLDTDGVAMLCRGDEQLPQVRVTGVDEHDQSVELAALLDESKLPAPVNLRLAAMRYVRREGFRWILAHPGSPDKGAAARALIDEAADWGLVRVDNASGVTLLRID